MASHFLRDPAAPEARSKQEEKFEIDLMVRTPFLVALRLNMD
jgi:hypothetical protein